ILLKARDAIEAPYALEVPRSGVRLDAVLWKRQPSISRLRAALPGATLADARLLDGGQVGLSVGVPPGRQLEAWRLDARTGALESVATGITGARLAFAPDGRHLAYIGAAIGPPRTSVSFGSAERPATVVWLLGSYGDVASSVW